MLLAAVLILIATGPADADAAPRITWMMNDYPPSNILSGPLAGQGFGDRTFRYFAERLPEFQYDISPASLQAFQELASHRQDGIRQWSLLNWARRISRSAPMIWPHSSRSQRDGWITPLAIPSSYSGIPANRLRTGPLPIFREVSHG
ncbi:MAG: hypothetical protein EKK69_12315 [Candidatus Competibacteraceae bacterium]|nr:MAG: hypothetical protein EKK69_12315 [Candidatus Competibacteraceae bacterium]